MEPLMYFTPLRKIWKNCRAEDLLEYALMAGFLGTMVVATMGSVAQNVRPIFSQVISVVALATSTGDPAAAPVVAPVAMPSRPN